MTMTEQTLMCPYCGKSIALSEAVARQVDDQLTARLSTESAVLESRLRAEYDDRMTKEIASTVEKEMRLRAEETALELEDLRAQVKEADARALIGREKELELRAAKRKLEEDKAELELEIIRRVENQRTQIEEELAQRFIEDHRLKDMEKDKKLQDLSRQIEDLKRKAEQGSQQTQGEVAEIELETLLKSSFPFDEIESGREGCSWRRRDPESLPYVRRLLRHNSLGIRRTPRTGATDGLTSSRRISDLGRVTTRFLFQL